MIYLLYRHTIEQNRWINFKLTQLSPSGAIEYGVSMRDAVGIWLNSTNPVQFREACYLTHCNEMCPEEITFKQDESFLWEDQVEVLIYCVIAAVTFICFVIKGLFYLWHWILLHKQKRFLEQSRDIETTDTFNQVCVCSVCMRACEHVYVRACVHMDVCVYAYGCVCVCVRVS